MNMAEDFGDSTGSGLVNTAGQAAKRGRSGSRDKGCGHRRKGRWRHLPLREAKGHDGGFQTKLAGASAAPSREHLVAKPDLSR